MATGGTAVVRTDSLYGVRPRGPFVLVQAGIPPRALSATRHRDHDDQDRQ
ncbi:hypothetical protein SAMN02787118_1762 [Streptomyces mirabilis]|jgi:hypothetical protein|uniref:Uncharacterized protein n=1 Tax=Streptomyces mirabilis TaxID=68239 RepID=A0A1I2YG54_9ACTN|nr:hypothetical protein SAMN02787118_1762 [Streptomyces mirabilis]